MGLFPFQRPGDITTGWSKNNRTTLGIDAGMTYQMGDHEIRAGLDIKQYTYRKYYLSTSAMEQVNRLVATSDDVATFDDAASGDNQTVTDELSLALRGGQIGYDDYGNEYDEGLDGPREPSSMSFHINDKYEAGDITVNMGVLSGEREECCLLVLTGD